MTARLTPQVRRAQIVKVLPSEGRGMSTAEVAAVCGVTDELARKYLHELEWLNRAHIAPRYGNGNRLLWLRGSKAGVLAFVADPDAPEDEVEAIAEITPRQDPDEPKQSVLKKYAPMKVLDHMRALPMEFFGARVIRQVAEA